MGNGTYSNDTALTPNDVRKILNADNKEIIRLCKKSSIVPRKNEKGNTYFSLDEVRILKRAKNGGTSTAITKAASQTVVENLLKSLKSMEENLTSSMTKVIDEKLEGMDEIVVELIRCKTENENLKNKVNELNKENFHLKNSLNSYKPLMFGFYVKQDESEVLL